MIDLKYINYKQFKCDTNYTIIIGLYRNRIMLLSKKVSNFVYNPLEEIYYFVLKNDFIGFFALGNKKQIAKAPIK